MALLAILPLLAPIAQTWVPSVRRGPWTWIAFFGGILKASFPQHQLPFLSPPHTLRSHPRPRGIPNTGKTKRSCEGKPSMPSSRIKLHPRIHCLHSMQRFPPLATEIKALVVPRPKSQQIFPTPRPTFLGVRQIPIETAEKLNCLIDCPFPTSKIHRSIY